MVRPRKSNSGGLATVRVEAGHQVEGESNRVGADWPYAHECAWLADQYQVVRDGDGERAAGGFSARPGRMAALTLACGSVRT